MNVPDMQKRAALAAASLSLAAIGGLLVNGCAATGASSPKPPAIPSPAETGEQRCFYQNQVQDFRVLDNSNLIVYAPNESNAYHVRIAPPSPELKFANSIGFVARSSLLCGNVGDAIVLDGAGGNQRYSVLAVSRLDTAGLRRLLERESGTAQAVPAPTPAGGAEIERDVGDRPQ